MTKDTKTEETKPVEVKKPTVEEEIKQIADCIRETIHPVKRKAFSIYFMRTGSDWVVDNEPSGDGDFIYRAVVSLEDQNNVMAAAAIIHEEISDFKNKKWQRI